VRDVRERARIGFSFLFLERKKVMGSAFSVFEEGGSNRDTEAKTYTSCAPIRIRVRGRGAVDVETTRATAKQAIRNIIKKGDAPLLLLVYKKSCVHCHRFAPYFNACADMLGENFSFLSIESDELGIFLSSGAKIGGSVSSFPTLRMLDTGRRKGVRLVSQFDNDVDFGDDDLAAARRLGDVLGVSEAEIYALLPDVFMRRTACGHVLSASKLAGLVSWVIHSRHSLNNPTRS